MAVVALAEWRPTSDGRIPYLQLSTVVRSERICVRRKVAVKRLILPPWLSAKDIGVVSGARALRIEETRSASRRTGQKVGCSLRHWVTVAFLKPFFCVRKRRVTLAASRRGEGSGEWGMILWDVSRKTTSPTITSKLFRSPGGFLRYSQLRMAKKTAIEKRRRALYSLGLVEGRCSMWITRSIGSAFWRVAAGSSSPYARRRSVKRGDVSWVFGTRRGSGRPATRNAFATAPQVAETPPWPNRLLLCPGSLHWRSPAAKSQMMLVRS